MTKPRGIRSMFDLEVFPHGHVAAERDALKIDKGDIFVQFSLPFYEIFLQVVTKKR